MRTKIEEYFIIQYQRLQKEDWYDDPAFSRNLKVVQEELRKLQANGVRYRIVKRTTYEEIV